ncbi:MAG: IPTL-CTERM sorting domain-containing protein [bacterium]|nr:IPTL-CTERM sorting domain-containing protein [bacterium]
MAFTENMPAGVDIADPSNVASSCLGNGGSITAAAGAVVLASGQLGIGATCTVTVDVTGNVVGAHTIGPGAPGVSLTYDGGSANAADILLIVSAGMPGFTKLFAPDSISMGGRSTLTFTIDNTANGANLYSLSFTDMLPTGLEVADPSNASTTCSGVTILLTADVGTNLIGFDATGYYSFNPPVDIRAVNAGASCTVSVDVIATGSGSLGNSSGDLKAGLSYVGKANDVLTVTRETLHLTKAFTDDPTPPGDDVTLEFTISNFDRFDSITGIAFTDDLDAALSGLTFDSLLSNDCGGSVLGVGTTDISFSGGTVAAQSSCTISVSLSVPSNAVPGAYPNATDAITGTLSGGGITGNIASDTLYVHPSPSLTKEFIDDPIGSGDNVTLRFTIENTSAASAATDISFTDNLGSSGLFVATLPADNSCGAGSTFSETEDGSNNVIFLMNGGVLDASGGANDSCQFDLILTANLPPGQIVNTTSGIIATVEGVTAAGSPASDTLYVVSGPRLMKSFTDDPVQAGETVTLEFTLTHDARNASAATDIAFTDDLSFLAGLTATGLPQTNICGTGSLIDGVGSLTFTGGILSPGDDCTFSVTLQTPAAAASGSYLNTTSAVTADVGGVTPTSSVAKDNLVIAALNFSKEFIDDPVIPGGTATLRFNIENLSDSLDATAITFDDDLDDVINLLSPVLPLPTEPCGAGSSIIEFAPRDLRFSGGNLVAGDSCQFDVTVTVPAGTDAGNYGNATTALSATIDGVPGASIAPATDPLAVQSEWLEFTKTFTDDPVTPGEDVTLEFTLTNHHPTGAATAISFTDDLNAALAGLAATGLPQTNICGGGSQITGGGVVSFTGGNLAADDSCTFDITVSTPAGVAATAVNTTSSVTGMINALPVTGTAASDTLQLDFLHITKAFDGPTTAGGTPTLTFTIQNMDAGAGASIIEFTDDLDATLTGLVATGLPLTDICGVGSEISGTDVLAFSEGSLGPGGSCTFDVSLQMPATAAVGDYPNTTSDIFSNYLPVGDPAADDLVVEPPPAFSKNFAPGAISYGGTSTLTFTIDNTASAFAASSLDFTDNLPAGVVVADPANASANCTGGTVTAAAGSDSISYTGGTVSAGASCTVLADVTSTTPATHNNTTGDLTSSSGNSGTASDALTVADFFDDGDGVPYLEESGPDGVTFDYDGNGDAIPDNIQGNVASFHTEDGANYVTLAAEAGLQLENVTAVPNPSPGNAPALQFPYGFFEFRVTNLSVGQTTTLNLILPDGAYASTYWKYGPIPGPPGARWYEFMFSGGTGATITANLISMVFVDGERGDDDLTADGVIIDQGGPGAPPDVPAPTLSEWGMILLSALLMAVACLAIRRKKLAPAALRRGRRGR